MATYAWRPHKHSEHDVCMHGIATSQRSTRKENKQNKDDWLLIKVELLRRLKEQKSLTFRVDFGTWSKNSKMRLHQAENTTVIEINHDEKLNFQSNLGTDQTLISYQNFDFNEYLHFSERWLGGSWTCLRNLHTPPLHFIDSTTIRFLEN